MKKRMISALLAFAVAVGGVCAPVGSGAFAGSQSIKASAWIEPGTETFEWGDYTCYYLADGTICVADCDENVILAVVPSQMDGVTVTKIGDGCFSGCEQLEAIKLPDTITTIDANFISGCDFLESVTIPKSVTNVNNLAFQGGSSALMNIYCDPDNQVYTSQGGMLYSKDMKTLVATPKGRETYTIPSSVEKLEWYSFLDCRLMEEIVIPDTVKEMSYSVFSNCKSLIRVSLPKGLKVLNGYTFFGCENLEYIYLPDSLEKIDFCCFFNCKKLKSMTIPPNVTYLGNYLFNDCAALEEVVIPTSVTGMGFNVFEGCTELKRIRYPGTKEQWKKINIDEKGNEILDPDSPILVFEGDKGSEPEPQAKISLKNAKIKAGNKTYSGKALKPAVTVTLDGKTLKSGTDYSVAYKNNVNCGKATVTVTGKGDYEGSKSGSFIIKPAKVASKKLTSPKTKTVKLTWTKAKGGVTGYQIVLGLNKKMTSGKKTVWVKKAAAAAKTVKGLKAKKTYYAKVRAYKQVGAKKYYGAWSTIRKAKCK